jgi:hypothetical protein
MSSPQIERVDAIPMLVTWLDHMAVATHIDRREGNQVSDATDRLAQRGDPCRGPASGWLAHLRHQ